VAPELQPLLSFTSASNSEASNRILQTASINIEDQNTALNSERLLLNEPEHIDDAWDSVAELEVHGPEVHHTVSGIALSMASRDAKVDETFEGIKEHSPKLLAHICRAPFSAYSGGSYGTNGRKAICIVCQDLAITVKAVASRAAVGRIWNF
jgi:hypothetical protein